MRPTSKRGPVSATAAGGLAGTRSASAVTCLLVSASTSAFGAGAGDADGVLAASLGSSGLVSGLVSGLASALGATLASGLAATAISVLVPPGNRRRNSVGPITSTVPTNASRQNATK